MSPLSILAGAAGAAAAGALAGGAGVLGAVTAGAAGGVCCAPAHGEKNNQIKKLAKAKYKPLC